MLENKDIACHFHCHRNVQATTDVLDRFRRVYPIATVHLISDGGADFSVVAAKFNCHYHYEPWNIGLQINTDEQRMHEWVRRMLYVCRSCVAPWILILEDDVLVRHKMRNVAYPMAGPVGRPNKRHYAGPLGHYVFARHPQLQNNAYGGGGGTLVGRIPAMEAIDAYLANESFDHWQRLNGGTSASDLWLTTMMMAAGYQYGLNPDLTESRKWQNTDCAIVHRWKDHTT